MSAGSEKIDASGEYRLNRVRYDEAGGQLPCGPAPVDALEHALVDQRADELLDEEGVALGSFDHHVAKDRGQLGSEELLEHSRGVGGSERLEPDVRDVRPSAPRRTTLGEIGTRSSEE